MNEPKFQVGDRVRVNGRWKKIVEVMPAHFSRHWPSVFFYQLSSGWVCGEGLLQSESDYEAKQAQYKAAAQKRWEEHMASPTREAERQAQERERIKRLREIDPRYGRGWAG